MESRKLFRGKGGRQISSSVRNDTYKKITARKDGKPQRKYQVIYPEIRHPQNFFTLKLIILFVFTFWTMEGSAQIGIYDSLWILSRTNKFDSINCSLLINRKSVTNLPIKRYQLLRVDSLTLSDTSLNLIGFFWTEAVNGFTSRISNEGNKINAKIKTDLKFISIKFLFINETIVENKTTHKYYYLKPDNHNIIITD